MDALIIALGNLCKLLLPSVEVICLICLIALLIRLIGIVKTVENTLLKTHKTIDLVDTSIEKIQQPLDTVAKVSDTVDKVHDAGVNAYHEAKDYVSKNAEVWKDKLGKLGKKEQEEVKEPSPEDLIGG